MPGTSEIPEEKVGESAPTAAATTAVSVDWEKCMEQVCDDVAFLEEVMNDLLNEAMAARDEIAASMDAANYVSVTKAAHKVKGSASYLYCGHLRLCAVNLQDIGQTISAGNTSPETLELLDSWYREYCRSYDDLAVEVKNRFS